MAATPEQERVSPSQLNITMGCPECDSPSDTYCPSCPSEPTCCKSCFMLTHVTPKKKLHELKPLSQKQAFNCPEHEEKLRLYCLVDRSLICSVCCFGSHKGHEALPVADAAEQLRGEVTHSLNSVVESQKETAKELDACQRKLSGLKTTLQRLELTADKLTACVQEKNPSIFLLSWVEAMRLSGDLITPTAASSLLNQAQWKILFSWLPKTSGRPQLLFSTAVHGWNVSEFHRLCDDKGPTLTIMSSPAAAIPCPAAGFHSRRDAFSKIAVSSQTNPSKQYLFGGYNPISWNSHENWSGTYHQDPSRTSFIFSLNKGSSPVKYTPSNYESAIEIHLLMAPLSVQGIFNLVDSIHRVVLLAALHIHFQVALHSQMAVVLNSLKLT